MSLQECERSNVYAKEGDQIPTSEQNNQLLYEQIKSIVTPSLGRAVGSNNVHDGGSNHINDVDHSNNNYNNNYNLNSKMNQKSKQCTSWSEKENIFAKIW